MPTKSGLIVTVIFFIIIAVVALSGSSLVEGFPYKTNMPQAAIDTLTALIAVTLFVERGMTVVNAILYGEEQRNIEVGLVDGSKSLQDLAKILGAKERVRLLGSFIAALFVSAAGVRTLERLMDVKVTGHPSNPFLIPVDVALTAALIAGGSNGLAYLLQIAKDRLGSGQSGSPPAARVAAPAPAPNARGAVNVPANPALRARLITTG